MKTLILSALVLMSTAAQASSLSCLIYPKSGPLAGQVSCGDGSNAVMSNDMIVFDNGRSCYITPSEGKGTCSDKMVCYLGSEGPSGTMLGCESK